MKQCAKCQVVKPLDQFPIGQLRCKSCRSIYNKQWADANREKVNENGRLYLTTVAGRASALFNSAKNRAKKKNEVFSLTRTHVIEGIERGYCVKTYFQFHLDLLPVEGRNYHMHPFSPSLDKIDPSKPYSDDNTQVVCSWYNLAKGQHTEEQLIEFCKRVALVDKLSNA